MMNRPQTSTLNEQDRKLLIEQIDKIIQYSFQHQKGEQLPQTLSELKLLTEAAIIEAVFRRTFFNQSETAELLKMNRGTLRKKLSTNPYLQGVTNL